MTAPTPEQGTHFWFMSIQAPTRTGIYAASHQGSWTPRAGQTRLDLFNEIYAHVEASDPPSRGGTVIAFDIQPNQL